ncbi:hypothetical protein HK098_006616 [Nowakowskiella sp. JEL0407]|nr:hypothetical protein HK098_006616 [Nowakowskiella sp. JEL0407]
MHRNIVKPAFSRPLKVEVFVKSVSKLLALLHSTSDKNLDIFMWMQRLTLDVLGQVIFSFDFESLNGQDGGQFVNLWKQISQRIFKPYYMRYPFLTALPTKWNRETWGYCIRFKGLMQKMVDERKKAIELGVLKDEKEFDLLDMMIAAESSEKRCNSNDLVHDLGIFFVAGHDTTSSALAVAIYHMAKYKEIQEKAREEVYANFGKPENRQMAIDVGPDHVSIGRLSYINCIIKESLRLFPSVPSPSFKKALKDVPITYLDQDDTKKTIIVPKGQLVRLDILAMHRDPIYYPNPEKFNPERWLDDTQTKPWLPFGGGPRICIGMQFSLYEQKIALAMLLRNFSFELEKLEDGRFPEYKTAPAQLLRPLGLKVRFTPIV